MLISAYQGAEYGGSISSIILGIPGTPAAVATVHRRQCDGEARTMAGKALGYSLYRLDYWRQYSAGWC